MPPAPSQRQADLPTPADWWGGGGNIHNSYVNNQVSASGQNSRQGGVIGYYINDSPSKNTFFNQSKNPTLKAVGEYSSRVDQSQVKNLTGKTEAELKQKATFKDWDFDKVWRISEGSDMPRLRALTEGKITIDGKDLLIKGVNLSKTYNGEPILTYDELSSLEGWKENGIIAVGMLSGDKLSDQSIFTGRLTLGGTWQGAVDVGDYTIIPSGLSSQKYEIEYQNGILTINPRQISLMGTRPYNATSMVKVDKNTKIIGDILPKDQGKLTISGSSKIVKSASGRFEDAQDVGTYRLLGGNLVVSSKNYIINPATSQWTITPKTIYLTGSANADDKKVVASQVDLNQLGIESVDKGKVSLTGQGTLNNNNKLANGHSFKLVGSSEAGNYKLNTTLAWKIISNPKPIEEPSTPSNEGYQRYAEELIAEAKKVRNLAGKDYIIAKNRNQFIDVSSLNRDIATAKRKARNAINQIKTANIRDELLKQVDSITQLPALDWALSGGGSSGGNNYTPPSTLNKPIKPPSKKNSIDSVTTNKSLGIDNINTKPPKNIEKNIINTNKTITATSEKYISNKNKIDKYKPKNVVDINAEKYLGVYNRIEKVDSVTNIKNVGDAGNFVFHKLVMDYGIDQASAKIVSNFMISFTRNLKLGEVVKLLKPFGLENLGDQVESGMIKFAFKLQEGAIIKLEYKKPGFAQYGKDIALNIIKDEFKKIIMDNIDIPVLNKDFEKYLYDAIDSIITSYFESGGAPGKAELMLAKNLGILSLKQTIQMFVEQTGLANEQKSAVAQQLELISDAIIAKNDKFQNKYERNIENHEYFSKIFPIENNDMTYIKKELVDIKILSESNPNEAKKRIKYLKDKYPRSMSDTTIKGISRVPLLKQGTASANAIKSGMHKFTIYTTAGIISNTANLFGNKELAHRFDNAYHTKVDAIENESMKFQSGVLIGIASPADFIDLALDFLKLDDLK